MTHSRIGTTLAFAAMSLFTHTPVLKAQAAQPPVQAALQRTQYERNPFLFINAQQAIQALDSSDILMRRSGVEWLGRWTAIDGGSAYSADAEARSRAAVRGSQSAVAALARAVSELPDADSQQAARLLALIGPSAKAAIPAICEAIAGKREDDWVGRADLTTCLTVLCGGTDGVPPQLIPLLHAKDMTTRRTAASVLAFRDDLVANRQLRGYNDFYLPPEVRRQRLTAFNRQVIPPLATSVNDPVTAVRLAATRALQSLTYDSAEAQWQKALPPLACAAASSDVNLRRTAAWTLALAPTDLSSVAPLLRGALHGGDDVTCSYAVTALYHAAWTNPARTLDAFLPDLASPDVGRRRMAAADMDRAAYALWNGNHQPGYEEVLDGHGNQDNVPTGRLQGWCLDFDRNVPPSEAEAVAAQRLTAGDAAKPRLLAALVQATSDPDHAVRADAALSLEKIGKWMDAMLYSGSRPNPAVQFKGLVAKSLAQAAASLQATEPALAKCLLDLNKRVQTPHPTA